MGQVDAVGIALNPGKAQKVAATAPTQFPPLTSEGIEPSITSLEHRATIGTRAPERQKRGGRSYAGSLEGGVRPVSMGTLFSMAFGEPVSSVSAGTPFQNTHAYTVGDLVSAGGYLYATTTAGTSAGSAPTWGTTVGGTTTSGTAVFTNMGPLPYVHTWNPIAAGKRPVPGTVWTINQDDPDDIIVDQYIAVGLNELGFTIEQNDYLLFTAAIVALRNVEGGSAPAITRDTSLLWSFDEIGMQLSVPSISSGAYEDVALYAWNFSYSNDIQDADRFQIGSKEAPKWREGNISSTVGFTAAEDIELHYRRAIADLPELVKVKLSAKGRLLYDAALAINDIYESLEIEFKAIEYSSGNVAIDAENPLSDIEIEGNAVIDGSGNLLSIVLTNTHNGADYLAPV